MSMGMRREKKISYLPCLTGPWLLTFTDEVEQRQKERTEKEAKDSRNLYLAREGIIREGTKVGNLQCIGSPSVFSVILYKLYSPLHRPSNLLVFLFFLSDDTSCLAEHKNLKKTHVNNELQKLAIWFKANKMAVIVLKKNKIIFHTRILKQSTLTVPV